MRQYYDQILSVSTQTAALNKLILSPVGTHLVCMNLTHDPVSCMTLNLNSKRVNIAGSTWTSRLCWQPFKLCTTKAWTHKHLAVAKTNKIQGFILYFACTFIKKLKDLVQKFKRY